MVPANSLVTVALVGEAGGWTWGNMVANITIDSVRSALAHALDALQLVPKDLSGLNTSAAANLSNLNIVTWPFQGTIIVRTLIDYPDVNAVLAAVGQAVDAATGFPPTSLDLVELGDPSDADPTIDTSTPNPIGGVADGITNAIASLHADVKTIVIIGAVLVAGVILVVGFGPNAPKLARIQL